MGAPKVGYTRPILSGFFIGIVFGICFEKSKVFLPQVIRGQMEMKIFIMLKVFLAATATGLIVIAVMESLGYLTRISKASRLFGTYGANILGGTLLGCGLTISGACPGTVLAQLGTWPSVTPSSPFVLLGCLVGALSFGYVHKVCAKYVDRFMESSPAPTLEKVFKKPLFPFSLGVAAMFAMLVAIFEYYFPWQSELKYVLSGNGVGESNFSLRSAAWPPAFAGMIIGLLQIPSYLSVGVSLGSSASYVAIAAQVSSFFDLKSKERAPYFASFSSPSDFYQVALIFGVFIGAVSSRYFGEPIYLPSVVVSPQEAFIGGLFLIYGARLAGGCTSGHGISGIARLSSASVITSTFMFVGGIATALLVY